MRVLLRCFLAWLDSRFPEKVVVTQAKYDAIADAMKEHGAYNINTRQITKLHEERLDKLEASVQGIKDLLNKTPRQSDAERRAEYIATGRMAA